MRYMLLMVTLTTKEDLIISACLASEYEVYARKLS